MLWQKRCVRIYTIILGTQPVRSDDHACDGPGISNNPLTTTHAYRVRSCELRPFHLLRSTPLQPKGQYSSLFMLPPLLIITFHRLCKILLPLLLLLQRLLPYNCAQLLMPLMLLTTTLLMQHLLLTLLNHLRRQIPTLSGLQPLPHYTFTTRGVFLSRLVSCAAPGWLLGLLTC